MISQRNQAEHETGGDLSKQLRLPGPDMEERDMRLELMLLEWHIKVSLPTILSVLTAALEAWHNTVSLGTILLLLNPALLAWHIKGSLATIMSIFSYGNLTSRSMAYRGKLSI